MAETAHDSHSSFIKTPKQLVTVIVLAFLVPIVTIILLVRLVTSVPSAAPGALAPEKVAERLQPVGRVEFGTPQAAAGSRSGEAVAKAVCLACHATGAAGAPKIGDAQAWAPRLKQGLDGLVASVLKGKGAMPPKGGDAALTEAEAARAVVYMANESGGKFKEPAAPAQKEAAKPAPAVPAPQVAQAPAEKPAAPAAAAGNGKAVYEKTCFACHGSGVAGAPKLGDKAAWAPRLQQGMDALVQAALKGKGAMPPKGGNMALPDADVRAAVEFMVSQSK